MEIRSAVRDDMPAIVALAYEFEEYLVALDDTLMSQPTPKETLREVMDEGFLDPKHDVLVAEDGGKVIGFADMWAYPDFTHGGVITWLQNLYVTGEYRRQGIGSQLLHALMERAYDRGAVAFHVTMKMNNEMAINFYLKHGVDVEHKMLETRLG